MGGNSKITWVGGQKFVGTDSTNHSIVLSTSDDNVGMRPSELLCVSLGSCTAVDIVSILQKKRAKLTGLEIVVTSEQKTDDWPRPYTAFHLHYIVKGVNLKDADVHRAIELSEEKYCSVAATLRPGASITYDYEIVNEAETYT